MFSRGWEVFSARLTRQPGHPKLAEGTVPEHVAEGVATLLQDLLAVGHEEQPRSAQLGAQFEWRGNRFYVAQRYKNGVSNGVDNGRLVGVAVPFGPDGELYSEYQWNELAAGAQQQSHALEPDAVEPRLGLLLPLMAQRRWEEAEEVAPGGGMSAADVFAKMPEAFQFLVAMGRFLPEDDPHSPRAFGTSAKPRGDEVALRGLIRRSWRRPADRPGPRRVLHEAA